MMHYPQAEATLYQDAQGVAVTTSRFVAGSMMYPIRGLTGVQLVQLPPDRSSANTAAMCFFLSWLLVLATGPGASHRRRAPPGGGFVRILPALLWCSVLGCAPAPVGILDAGPDDVPGLEVAPDDVPVAVDAPPDAGPDAFEAPPPPDVAVAVDARPAALTIRVSFYAPERYALTSARCSASGWGTAAGVAVTWRAGFTDRAPDSPERIVMATVSPGAVGSLMLEGSRLTSGVMTFVGDPYRAADGSERVDLESTATFPAMGRVTATVTGCPVVP